MTDLCCFVYPSRFQLGRLDFGPDHPFQIHRYHLTSQLINELGLLDGSGVRLIDCDCADEESLLAFHDPKYLRVLKEFSADSSSRADFFYGLGDAENPVFHGCYDWASLVCGATLEAQRQVLDEGARLAFNMTGGMHHAHAARASGFSYLNDAVVAIQAALERELRVAYVDIDAHHGDGVQQAFYETERVLTISLHESGKDFFPHTGFSNELGRGAGYGYSVNVPFAAHSDDLIFEQAFCSVVLPLLEAYRPDLLVTQLGVDGMRTDPLTRLEFTTRSLEFAVKAFLKTGLPWVALGGGGYDKINVARCWALAWAAMTEKDVDNSLPASFIAEAQACGHRLTELRDRPHSAHPNDFARAQESLEHTLRFVARRIFPLHGISLGATP